MIDLKSDKTSGYHLFLQPSGVLEEHLHEIVASLAREYSGPLFDPHITLLAQIPIEAEDVLIEKTKKLAQESKAFPITFGGIGMEDTYFRAFYIQIELSEDLSKLHVAANAIFGMTDERSYMPHLSLLYGNYPEDEKKASASFLGQYRGMSFVADSITLYKTDGEPKNWRKIQTCTFKP